MTKDQRKLLETAAQAAEKQADAHRSDCEVGAILRSVGAALRGVIGEQPKGPACVATDAYRNGWETLFGKKQTVGQA